MTPAGADGQAVVYSIRIVNVLVFLRLYLMFRFQRHHSRTRSDSSRVLALMYGMPPSRLLCLKEFLYSSPTTIIGVSFLGALCIFAYLVLIFERPATIENSIYPERMTYALSFWFIWAVMLTVGLGDVFPVTTLGRAITVCSSAVGIILSALLIGFVSRTLELSRLEEKVGLGTSCWADAVVQMLFMLDRVERRKAVPQKAARVIQVRECERAGVHFPQGWWRRRCKKITLQEYSKIMRQWKLARRMNADLSNAFDPADVGPQIQELHDDVRAMMKQMAETRNEQQRLHKSIDAIESRARRTWAVIEAMADNIVQKRRTRGINPVPGAPPGGTAVMT